MITNYFFEEFVAFSKFDSEYDLELYLYLFLPFLVGILCCYTKCIPYAIHGTAYLLFVSIIHHNDIMRYSLPALAPAILIGLDPLFSSHAFKATAKVSLPIILVLGVVYATNQINDNKASLFFFKKVLNTKMRYY